MTKAGAIDICMEVRDYLTSGNPIWDKGAVSEALNMAIEALQTDIVRCKDCRWYAPIDENKPFPCWHGISECSKDDFCSYGERREDK